jgi:PTH1 family peptidyl-tRNA hydrolase
MFLIVGLGNPGDKYDHTRHNVGFDVLTILSEKLRIPITRLKSRALVGEGQFMGEKVALCKPQTYMNLSGEAVQALMHWYKVPPENLLVIYDDIDLDAGWLRIRKDGSAGTHNGMRSIVACIGTDAFPRIRVGIGCRPPQFELADWVLSHYNTPAERQTAFDAYTQAADAAIEWMKSGVQSAITRFNTKRPKPPKPERVAQTGGQAGTAAQAATVSATPVTPAPPMAVSPAAAPDAGEAIPQGSADHQTGEDR